MNVHEFISIIILPMVLFKFIINYLSDSEIKSNFVEIGIHQFLHHISSTMGFSGAFLSLFFVNNLNFSIFIISLIVFTQGGFLINNDYCWYTRYVNTLINSDKPKKKWVNALPEFIQHYSRGDEWANSDMRPPNYYSASIKINVICIIILIKLMLKK